jgi:hypothetical protein
VTRNCHPFGKLRASSEAKPKDLISGAIKRFSAPLRSAQNDSFAVTLAPFRHFSSLDFASYFGFLISYPPFLSSRYSQLHPDSKIVLVT